MKRCPQCNRNYPDDALSFCLDDGSPLVSANAPSSFDPSATVQYPQGRDTSPPPTVAYSGQPAPAPPPPPQGHQPPPAWSPMPMAPQKRSVWPWLLGIGAVMVFLVIGLVIVIFAIARVTNTNNGNRVANTNTNTNANRNSNRNSNSTNRNANDNSNSNGNANTRSSLTSFTDDFSEESWWTGTSAFGRAWYDNDEYHVHATNGRYIVLYSPDQADYRDENATVRVGMRSIDGDPPQTGYGLVVHGEKKNDNLEDYGFLIYNGTNPKYKVVLHRGGKETPMVEWTSSSTIRTGTLPNQMEVRIRDTKMDLYING
ncbi:MAG TPA: hypothetical protein VE863_08985, partial [Pyrinomonadaceae bacterium]|nr:hypothetical protein [Pyrinomonadaceae bacterium]